MSKSALYAGLGQGLMSLGQNVGEAYRMKAIEELRQENLKQNWARQDAIRAEDRAWKIERDEAKFGQQKEVAQMGFDREDAKTPSKEVYEEVDGKRFKVAYGKDGNEIKRTELSTQEKLPPMLKMQVESLNEEIVAIQKSGMMDGDEAMTKRYNTLVTQRNKLLNMKSPEGGDGEFTSTISGYTAEQVIQKFMETNNVDRETAITLAKQQGRLR